METNELLNKLLKRINLNIRLIGIAYFVGYLLSAWVALRMFLYKACSTVTLTWQYPTRNLTLVFCIWMFVYVIVSQFWRYMFYKYNNIDDVETIKKLFKLWFVRLGYIVLLGIFIGWTYFKIDSFDGGMNFYILICVLLGVQIVALSVLSIMFRITYKKIEAL